ncbi:cuticle protein 8-like [Homarus americanus]|uniref:Pro-resilin-like 125 n=1 Tax=Homarus americanus TaxID=6706 RepID=A0A8J5JVB9_HOMAM|nr:cuticle protein 8-like [Homarus americanus]KAG7161683.1 Pro-resilin-like 125 [Homarus americanus]
MILKVALVVVMVGVTVARPADLYGAQNTYKEEALPYDFAYGVKDDYAGTDFGAAEQSDGNTVRGSYTVALPDGRKQTVNYEADHEKGFVADVQYSGDAQYPHEYGPPITFKPKNNYQPQTSYQ